MPRKRTAAPVAAPPRDDAALFSRVWRQVDAVFAGHPVRRPPHDYLVLFIRDALRRWRRKQTSYKTPLDAPTETMVHGWCVEASRKWYPSEDVLNWARRQNGGRRPRHGRNDA